MLKILATTDFSANSKMGLRFAIQLVDQLNAQNFFLHMYQIMSPTSCNAARKNTYEVAEEEKPLLLFQGFTFIKVKRHPG